jgi:hypothetical protein
MMVGVPSPHVARLARCIVALAACCPPALEACDSSACLLVTRGRNGVLARGMFRLDASFRHTDETVKLEGSREVERVLRPKVDFENLRLRPGYHDELGGSDTFLQLDAGYGLTSRLSLLLSVPLFARRAYDVGHAPVASESYTTHGNGDTLLGARYGFPAGTSGFLVTGLSVELPTGAHDLDAGPGLVDRGILDPALQPGSGSWDVVASTQYSARWPPAGLDCTLSATYQLNTQNDLRYGYGDVAIASMTASRALGTRVSASVQLKGVIEERSAYLEAPVPATGSKVVYLVPGLNLGAFGNGSLYVYLPLPLYRYVNETQLAPRASLVVGVSKTFAF